MSKIKTLIVDDEPLARRGLLIRLQAFDLIDVVGEAANGKQAVELIESLKPDLVFLDIQMPGISGFDWLELFRELPEAVQSMCRIYMLSASIDRGELNRAEQDPSVIALMEKPLDVYMFRQLVDL